MIGGGRKYLEEKSIGRIHNGGNKALFACPAAGNSQHGQTEATQSALQDLWPELRPVTIARSVQGAAHKP